MSLEIAVFQLERIYERLLQRDEQRVVFHPIDRVDFDTALANLRHAQEQHVTYTKLDLLNRMLMPNTLEVFVVARKNPDGFFEATAALTVNYSSKTFTCNSRSERSAISYALTELAVAIERGEVKYD